MRHAICCLLVIVSGCGSDASQNDLNAAQSTLHGLVDGLTQRLDALQSLLMSTSAQVQAQADVTGPKIDAVRADLTAAQMQLATYKMQLDAVAADVAALKMAPSAMLLPHLDDGKGVDLGIVLGRYTVATTINKTNWIVDYQTERQLWFDGLNCTGNAVADQLLADAPIPARPVINEAIPAFGRFWGYSSLQRKNLMAASQVYLSATGTCANLKTPQGIQGAFAISDLGPAPAIDLSKVQIVFK